MSIIRGFVLKDLSETSSAKERRIREIIIALENEPYYNKHMALLRDDSKWKELRVILSVDTATELNKAIEDTNRAYLDNLSNKVSKYVKADPFKE
jgi:hypothetical protein